MEFQAFMDLIGSKTGKTPTKSGGGYSSRCPAHEDEHPSLSIKEGSDGKILINCFSGCPIEAICASLGLEISDLFESDVAATLISTRTLYSYKDEEGHELYRKIRIEPGYNGKKKSFYSEHTDENGQTVRNLDGCRRVLYRLQEVLKGIRDGAQIYLVEGEKDADKLAGYGLVATTSLESTKWSEEFTEMLKGADVVILYDMDDTGFKRRDLLCKSLHNIVKRLRVVDLPGLQYQESHGADVTDWLAMGNTSSDLVDLVCKTPDYGSPNQKRKIIVVTMGEFLKMKLPVPEMILAPFIITQTLCLLYSKRGVGKTHVALGIAYAVATGGSFLKWKAPKSRPVLYIDGEMSASAMQERLRRISVTDDSNPAHKDFLRLITPDLQEGSMPNLSTREGQLSIEKYVESSELIIVDNLSCLFRGGIENDAESWIPAQEWALDLRRRKKTVLFNHHAGKSGQQRGTSKKEDILDTVISLKHPEGYRPEEGARFEVHFEKTRHFAGEDASPFEVRLREQEDGLWFWETSNVQRDPQLALVAELTNKGCTISQIMEETGLTKSQVTTRQNKAKALGLLD